MMYVAMGYWSQCAELVRGVRVLFHFFLSDSFFFGVNSKKGVELFIFGFVFRSPHIYKRL